MVLTEKSLRRVRAIHTLSRRVNAGRNTPHARKLLSLMKEHAAEIEELLGKGDAHHIVETGDLIVLCLELLLESGRSPDAVIEESFRRYERKLNELLPRRRKRTVP